MIPGRGGGERPDPASRGARCRGADPTVEFPPDDLPRRRVFWREEMADEAVQAQLSTTAA